MKILLALVSTYMGLWLFSAYSSEVYDTFSFEYRKRAIDEGEPDYYKLPSEVELTPAEFQRMKKILSEAVSRYNERVKHTPNFSIEPLSRYGVQYKIMLTKKGEKEIWINGFCKGSGNMYSDIDLTSKPVEVFDGGSCYFNLTINLKKRKVSKVIIHGFA